MYKHGVGTSEVETSVFSPIEATAGLQVFFGTAPINLAESTEYVNKPLLAYTDAEAKKALGYSDDWENYTLCEGIDSTFGLFGVAPAIFINVLDPEIHNSTGTAEVEILNKKALVPVKGILMDTLKVKLLNTGEELKKGTDYVASFDSKGEVLIAVVPGGTIPAIQDKLTVEFTKIDPSKVTKNQIIGGFDSSTGKSTGLELINSVFPKFRLVPGQIIVPKFSTDPTVEAIMKAKAANINSFFKAVALVDVDTLQADNYTKVAAWKNENNYTSANEFVCWPKVGLGDKVYHMSTQLAGLSALVDSSNGDVPFESPSNKAFQMNKLILASGETIDLGPEQATYLNGQGIVTALNWIGGWRAWGNRTGAYPAITDVKDSFIPVRRMHNWISNSIILTTWQKVDKATNTSLVDSVVDSLNMWFNGLTSDGALLGGRVEFRKEDNPKTNLLDGIIRYRVMLAEPTPARSIEFILEVDVNYYDRLFS